MKIDYKTKINGRNYYDSYDILDKKYCCKKLEEIDNGEGAYKFGADVFKLEGSHFKDIKETELEFSLIEYYIEDIEGYNSHEVSSYNHPIKYCPFCGAEIVLNEVKKVKVIKHTKKVPKTICKTVVTHEEEIEVN